LEILEGSDQKIIIVTFGKGLGEKGRGHEKEAEGR
jgi:hypothetical protein